MGGRWSYSLDTTPQHLQELTGTFQAFFFFSYENESYIHLQ